MDAPHRGVAAKPVLGACTLAAAAAATGGLGFALPGARAPPTTVREVQLAAASARAGAPAAGVAGASSATASKTALATMGVAAAAVTASSRRQCRSARVAARVHPDQFVGVCEQTGVTLSRYLFELQKRGVIDSDLSSIFNSIREASKVIAKLVSTAPLRQAELLGLEGAINVQGEDQKKLDVITNEVFKRALRYCGKVGTLASEEEDAPVLGSNHEALPVLSDTFADTGKYVCVFDPLDGSSNVDAGIAVGTIFGVFAEPEKEGFELSEDLTHLSVQQKACLASTLQPGKSLVASGYVLYSASVELVLTFGRGVVGFTLDASIGEFVLTRPSIQIPKRGKIYSLNQANIQDWDLPMQKYINALKSGTGESKTRYSLRYIGSMVGDIHRTLLYGGVFAYPADKQNKDGKLRLLYEGAPMSFIIEQAGGKATTGLVRVMDITPVKVHQRIPVVMGSPQDVDECQKYYLESHDARLKENCMARLEGSWKAA